MSCVPVIGDIHVDEPIIIKLNQLFVKYISYTGLVAAPNIGASILPSGVTFTESYLSGTPTEKGVFPVIFYGQDSNNNCIFTKKVNIIVAEASDYSSSALADPKVNQLGTSFVNSLTGDSPDVDYQFFDYIRMNDASLPAEDPVGSGYPNESFVLESILSNFIFPSSASLSYTYKGKIGFLDRIKLVFYYNDTLLKIIDQEDISEFDPPQDFYETIELDENAQLAIINDRRSKFPSKETISVRGSVNIKYPGNDRRLDIDSWGITLNGYESVFESAPNPYILKLYPSDFEVIGLTPVYNSDETQVNLHTYINNTNNSTYLYSNSAEWYGIAKFELPESSNIGQKIDKIKFNITYQHTDGEDNKAGITNPRIYRDDNNFASGWCKGIFIDDSNTFIEKSEYFANLNNWGFNNWFYPDDIADENGEICVAFSCPKGAKVSSISIDLYDADSNIVDMYSSGYQPSYMTSELQFYNNAAIFTNSSIDMYSVRNKSYITAFLAYSVCTEDSIKLIDLYSTSGLINSSINMFNNAEYEYYIIDLYSRGATKCFSDIIMFTPGQPAYPINSEINFVSNSSLENSVMNTINIYSNSEIDTSFSIDMYCKDLKMDDNGTLYMYLNCDNIKDGIINAYLKNDLKTSLHKFDALMFSAYNYNESIDCYIKGDND